MFEKMFSLNLYQLIFLYKCHWKLSRLVRKIHFIQNAQSVAWQKLFHVETGNGKVVITSDYILARRDICFILFFLSYTSITEHIRCINVSSFIYILPYYIFFVTDSLQFSFLLFFSNMCFCFSPSPFFFLSLSQFVYVLVVFYLCVFNYT